VCDAPRTAQRTTHRDPAILRSGLRADCDSGRSAD